MYIPQELTKHDVAETAHLLFLVQKLWLILPRIQDISTKENLLDSVSTT